MTARLVTVHLSTDNAVPYALNDCIGGLQSIVGANFNEGGNTSLIRLTVHDRDKEAKPLDIHLYSEGPSSATSTVNNQQYNIAFADLKKELALIPIAAADYKTHISGATATWTGEVPIVVRSNQGSLCMAIEAKAPGAITYSSVQSLAIDLLFK